MIELLVAMTLLGVLMAMLAGGVNFGRRAWELGEARLDLSSRTEAVEKLVRRLLSQTRPVMLTNDQDQRFLAFEGHPDSIRFIAPMSPHLSVAGLYAITLGTVAERSAGALMMAWRLYEPRNMSSGDLTQGTVLLENVSATEFSYFGSATRGAAPQWHARWVDVPVLPSLIRVRIRPRHAEQPDIPDLVVALRIAPPNPFITFAAVEPGMPAQPGIAAASPDTSIAGGLIE